MREFEYHNINEMGHPNMFMDGKPHPRFGHELLLLERTNKTLMANFHKICHWIEENCPNLSGEFGCRHNPYYKIHLIIENGKAYLCTGTHSVGYELYLSSTETAVYSQGSCQGRPYGFKNTFFYRNDRLEEFLSQWKSIKDRIILANSKRKEIYDNNFIA